MTKKGLIFVVHGSRVESANLETSDFAKRVSGKLSGFSLTIPAFLEFTSPTVDEAIDSMAGMGFSDIVVFPYFLSGGSHLKDLKADIERASRKYSTIRFALLTHLGALSGLEDFIGASIGKLS